MRFVKASHTARKVGDPPPGIPGGYDHRYGKNISIGSKFSFERSNRLEKIATWRNNSPPTSPNCNRKMRAGRRELKYWLTRHF